jgi:hypothetical protein
MAADQTMAERSLVGLATLAPGPNTVNCTHDPRIHVITRPAWLSALAYGVRPRERDHRRVGAHPVPALCADQTPPWSGAQARASPSGHLIPDTIPDGEELLMQAARRFDPERGFRLPTYALWWIRTAIQDYALRL